jgi:hypothetical protein
MVKITRSDDRGCSRTLHVDDSFLLSTGIVNLKTKNNDTSI